MKISVIGLGYVGLSNLLLFAPNHEIYGCDTNKAKIVSLKNNESPINEREVKEYLLKYGNKIYFTSYISDEILRSDMIIIATPTDYDEHKNYFDTSSVEKIIDIINVSKSNAVIVIKSTVPFGFTKKLQKQYSNLTIIFSPEFLREGKALYDNLYPSRIVVGDKSEKGKNIANIFKSSSLTNDVKLICTGSDEAEAIKLFANNYLAMRVAYFNELDSFALKNDLNTEDVINGISTDPRIASGYNNPSFGYGGYCLPKDTKQLLANFSNVPQNLIQAIVDSNETRKNFIVENVLSLKPKIVGVYRLVMKEGSDNFRSSSIRDIILKLHAKNISIVLYEPTLTVDTFEGFPVLNNLNDFACQSDIILANRINDSIKHYKDKLFTRDLFHEN